jgi:hypothetical protein
VVGDIFIFFLQGDLQKDQENIRDFFEKFVEFQRFCLEIDMPLRGGVSYGHATADPLLTQIVTFLGGTPVVQAVRIEESLKMCGICFVPHITLKEKYHQEYKQWIDFLKDEEIIMEFDTPTDFGLLQLLLVKWPEGTDLVKISEEFTKLQPEKAEDLVPPKKDIAAASKYYSAMKFICKGRDDDE